MSAEPSSSFTRAHDASVYYGSGYWNDLPVVEELLERRGTGREGVRWFEHLLDSTGVSRFGKALVLNCGNGWVERELLAEGVVEDVVGIDISEELLEQARDAAREQGLPARYYRCDINDADFPEGGFDLVVNYAAAHHIAYLDKVVRRLAEVLPEDGVFVSWDYVGPHRNQWPYAQWQAASELNDSLPPAFRSPMRFPNLPASIAADPTEAIHSELVLPTVRRYFALEHFRPLGGNLAYLLLTHNEGVHAHPGAERDAVVERVLAADESFMTDDTTIFAYFWGRPDKAVLDDTEQLARWTAEESAREQAAQDAGGEYYPRSVLHELTDGLDRLTGKHSHLQDVHAHLAQSHELYTRENARLLEENARFAAELFDLRDRVVALEAELAGRPDGVRSAAAMSLSARRARLAGRLGARRGQRGP